MFVNPINRLTAFEKTIYIKSKKNTENYKPIDKDNTKVKRINYLK